MTPPSNKPEAEEWNLKKAVEMAILDAYEHESHPIIIADRLCQEIKSHMEYRKEKE